MAEYIVTFREPAVVTEVVEARTAREAIEKVKNGEGDRVDFVIDETVNPTRYQAVRTSDCSGS